MKCPCFEATSELVVHEIGLIWCQVSFPLHAKLGRRRSPLLPHDISKVRIYLVGGVILALLIFGPVSLPAFMIEK